MSDPEVKVFAVYGIGEHYTREEAMIDAKKRWPEVDFDWSGLQLRNVSGSGGYKVMGIDPLGLHS